MQSDRNSSKTDTFHEPITYKRHVQTDNEQKTTFARHDYGRVELRLVHCSRCYSLLKSVNFETVPI